MPLSSDVVGRRTRRFRHDVDARWLMAYAAALDESAACYFDTTSEVTAHPVFPVCLEWPVVLDSRNLEGSKAMSAAELGRGVHATHDMFIHRPIRAGLELFTDSIVIGVEPRASHALQMTRLETRDADGELYVTTYQGSLFRNVSVQGEGRWLEQAPVLPDVGRAPGQSLAFPVPVAAGAAHRYTECARIWNPIHTDRAIALGAGLPDIILHGTATLALAVSAVVRECLAGDPERVKRVAGRFSGMVLMPTTLSVRVTGSSDEGVFFQVGCGDAVVIEDGFVGT